MKLMRLMFFVSLVVFSVVFIFFIFFFSLICLEVLYSPPNSHYTTPIIYSDCPWPSYEKE